MPLQQRCSDTANGGAFSQRKYLYFTEKETKNSSLKRRLRYREERMPLYYGINTGGMSVPQRKPSKASVHDGEVNISATLGPKIQAKRHWPTNKTSFNSSPVCQ
uniref:Uncharacterized protein n=1 Tax=Parascaris univalens TaxID=6257 RepID=A0A915B3Z7_PARUN